MSESWILMFTLVGMMAGILMGFWYGLKMSTGLVTRVWLEVPHEYSINVFNHFKNVKGVRMSDFPSYLEQEVNGKMKCIPPKSIIEFRRTKMWLEHNDYCPNSYLRHLVEQVEKMDIVVLNSGVA